VLKLTSKFGSLDTTTYICSVVSNEATMKDKKDMTLTERNIEELKNAGLTETQIEERVKQVELLNESRTRGFNFWSGYGKVRLYFTIAGGNKNRKGFVDLVNGTIEADKPSMYRAVHEINEEANFEVK